MPSTARQVAPGATHLIDLTRPDSWPAPLRELIDTLAALTPRASHVSDLSTPDDGDERVRAVIAGAHLRAYHTTRLLDHEREMIIGQGLRAFSEDLFNDRIGAALTYDTISAEQHDTLLASHMYATGEAHTRGHREGQVCLILSDHTFDDEPSGVTPLLGAWGGEGIYFSKLGVHLPSALRRLG